MRKRNDSDEGGNSRQLSAIREGHIVGLQVGCDLLCPLHVLGIPGVVPVVLAEDASAEPGVHLVWAIHQGRQTTSQKHRHQ